MSDIVFWLLDIGYMVMRMWQSSRLSFAWRSGSFGNGSLEELAAFGWGVGWGGSGSIACYKIPRKNPSRKIYKEATQQTYEQTNQ